MPEPAVEPRVSTSTNQQWRHVSCHSKLEALIKAPYG
jgi:hypothetical protein